jgi:hypothetical protein
MINWLREIKAHRSRFYLRAGPERITLFKVTTASGKWQGEKWGNKKGVNSTLLTPWMVMVGDAGFEPATPAV